MDAHFSSDEFATDAPIVDYDRSEISTPRTSDRRSPVYRVETLIDRLDPVAAVFEPVNS